jgi:hypothetical protein
MGNWLLVGLLTVTGARGCFGYESNPPEDGGTEWVPLPGAVDLLVVVDNSNSMREEQAVLSAEFTDLVRGLVDPPDLDDDDVPDYPPVTDLHVGVVSTDIGTGGHPVQTCDGPAGDDGVLRDRPSGAIAGCAEEYPRFLEFTEVDDPAVLGADFECLATLGTGGCGFEQHLGAVHRALTAHGEGPNAGFLRDGSVLAVLIVSDEDDCTVSAESSDIFDVNNDLGPLNLRCFEHAEYVDDVATLVQGLLALRPGHPERVIVGGVLGIPVDSGCDTGDMGADDFNCLLDHPEMQQVIDHSAEGKGERTVPSCAVPGLGEAFAPRRLVQFVRDVQAAGGSGNVQSICQSDWSAALANIAREIQEQVAE